MAAILAQIEGAIPQLVASIVIAGLSWGGSQILNRLKRAPAAAIPQAPQPTPTPSGPVAAGQWPQTALAAPGIPAQPAKPAVSWGQVLLHVGILQLAVNAAGLVVGILVAMVASGSGADAQSLKSAFVLIQLPVGTLTAMVAFMLFGLRVARAIRWRHLTFVALGTVVLTLVVDSVFEQTLLLLNPVAILFALIQTFIAMGLGGVLANVIGPKTPAPAPVPAVQFAAPYAGAAPYGYGAWPPNAPGDAPYPANPSGPMRGAAPAPPYPGYAPAPQPPHPGNVPAAQPPYPYPGNALAQPQYPYPAYGAPAPAPYGPYGPSAPGYPPQAGPQQPGAGQPGAGQPGAGQPPSGPRQPPPPHDEKR